MGVIVQERAAKPEHQIRPRAIARFVHKTVVIEVDHATGNTDSHGNRLHSVTVSSGVCQGARRHDRNAMGPIETVVFFEGGHAISFYEDDLVIITDLTAEVAS